MPWYTQSAIQFTCNQCFIYVFEIFNWWHFNFVVFFKPEHLCFVHGQCPYSHFSYYLNFAMLSPPTCTASPARITLLSSQRCNLFKHAHTTNVPSAQTKFNYIKKPKKVSGYLWHSPPKHSTSPRFHQSILLAKSWFKVTERKIRSQPYPS